MLLLLLFFNNSNSFFELVTWKITLSLLCIIILLLISGKYSESIISFKKLSKFVILLINIYPFLFDKSFLLSNFVVNNKSIGQGVYNDTSYNKCYICRLTVLITWYLCRLTKTSSP